MTKVDVINIQSGKIVSINVPAGTVIEGLGPVLARAGYRLAPTQPGTQGKVPSITENAPQTAEANPSWFRRNKKWLFAGAGILGAAGLGFLGKRFHSAVRAFNTENLQRSEALEKYARREMQQRGVSSSSVAHFEPGFGGFLPGKWGSQTIYADPIPATPLPTMQYPPPPTDISQFLARDPPMPRTRNRFAVQP